MFHHHSSVDAATHVELACYPHKAGLAGLYKVAQHIVGHFFVEGTLLTERPHVELERLELKAVLIGHVVDLDGGKVGLAGLGAEAGELGNIDMNRIVPLRHWIIKSFEIFVWLGRHDTPFRSNLIVPIHHIHLLSHNGVISVLGWSHIAYMFTFSVRKCLVLEQNLNMLNRYTCNAGHFNEE